MTSDTCLVKAGTNRYVAKLVPRAMRGQFRSPPSATDRRDEAACPALALSRWALPADFFTARVMRQRNEDNHKGPQDAGHALLG